MSQPQPGRDVVAGRRRRLVGCCVGVLLVVLGGVAHWSGSIVHDRLLNEDFYSATLVEQHVYRRVYSEVLVDPQLRAATNRMLGSLTIDPSRVAAVTAVSTAVLRLAIPPSALRSATEAALERVLAYVRGDVDVLDATIDLRGALRGLDESAEILLAEVLSSLPKLSATTIEEYRSQVAGFVGAVERGEIPASVPGVVAAGLSDSDIIAAIEDALRHALPERAVDQVAAAVQSGDDAGAMIAASATLLAAHVRAVRNDPLLASTLEIDLLDVLGPYAGQQQQVVIDQIERLRHASGWLPHWLQLTALALMVTGLAIIIMCSRRVSAASCWTALAMLASAIATWLVATLASRWWTSPLERAAVRSPSNTLPRAVVEIASDVDGAIGAALQRSTDARIVAFVMLAVAAITPAVAISAIARVRASRTRTVLAACALVAVVASAAAWWQLAPRTQATTRECNGHVELCGRTYDTVVQAATQLDVEPRCRPRLA